MFSVPPWYLPQYMYVTPVSIRKSVNLLPTVRLPGAPVGKLESDASSPRESPGLFIYYQSVPLFLLYERLLSPFYYFLSFSLV